MPVESRRLANIAKAEGRVKRIGGRGYRKFSKRSLEKIAKVNSSTNFVTDWDDWSLGGFPWMRRTFRESLAPPTLLTISQYADLYRQIATEFASEPGQWHTDKFEPMREVMDACSPQSKYRRVVLVKPVQSGGTESVVLNTIAHTIDCNPRSMLVVFPTLDSTESFSKERLEPMVALMPSLSDKVVESSSAKGGAASTVKKKKYPGGFLNMVGANSTTGLSSRPVPIVIVDEVDLCIKNSSKLGSPIKLALARTTTFYDKKEILLSSPLCEEGESGIIPFWEEGTMAKLERECPNYNCRHYQVLDFARMDTEGSATLACEKCGQYYPQWKWQTTNFRWHCENPDHDNIASFWMTGLDSPWLDWKVDIWEDYIACRKVADSGDDSLLRVFINSKLAQYYRRKGKRVEIDLYHERREVYECHSHHAELPDGVILVTAGVDIMDTFITYDVKGWGRGRESWGIESGEFQGDPAITDGEVWKQLDNFVYRRLWNYSDGTYARTRLMFVDSQGHKTDAVYKYCKSRHPRCFAIKGIGGSGHPIIIGGKRREKGEGAWRINLGVDTLKDEFHSRLSIDRPGPGYCHWPMLANGMPCCGYTLEYFEEIISEQKEIVYNKLGFSKFEWTKNRTDPNEALDNNVYARAALEYLKVKLEQIPRDVLANLPEQDIERVEIGLDRVIIVDRSKRSVRKAVNQYGAVTRGGYEEDIPGKVQTKSVSTGTARTTTRYGAGSSSSF